MLPGVYRCVQVCTGVYRCVQVCYARAMRLSQYAKQQGISYRTALRWFRVGTIKGYQAPTGTIIVTDGEPLAARPEQEQVAVYARVSSPDHRDGTTWNASPPDSQTIARRGAIRWLRW
jgi:ferredoxin